MKKLILFGDSLIARTHKTVCEEIEQQNNLEVYNCATSGWDSADGAKKAAYIASLKPDVVIFSFGMNDAAPWRKIELADFKKNLTTIFAAFATARKIFFLPPPVDEQVSSPGRQRSNAALKSYSDAAKELSDQSEVEVINSWELFTPFIERGQNYHDADGVHLDPFGYEQFATAVNAVLKSA